MKIRCDVVIFEFFGKISRLFLAIIKCDHDGAHINTFGAKKFNEAQNFGFIGNHMVGTNFGLFNSVSIDAKNYFSIFFEFLKEANFKIRQETRQSARGVLIVNQFSAKFQIEFIKHFDATLDFFLLDFEIFVCVEAFFSHFARGLLITLSV